MTGVPTLRVPTAMGRRTAGPNLFTKVSRLQAAGGVVVVGRRQADLTQMTGTLRAPSGLASLLNRRQQQCDKDADDRDNDEQFDERESESAAHGRSPEDE